MRKLEGVKNEIAGLDATKKTLGERIAQEGSVRKKLQECEDNIKKLERERNETVTKKKEVKAKLEEIRENKAEFDTKASEKTTLQEQLKIDEESEEKVRGQIEQAENAVKKLESLKPRLEQRTQLDDQLRKLTRDHERLKVAVDELQEKAKGIEQKIKEESENCQKIKDYAVPECPICKRPLDEPHRKQLLQEYEQRIGALQTDRDQAAKNAEQASNTFKDQVAPAIRLRAYSHPPCPDWLIAGLRFWRNTAQRGLTSS